jgi:hypothetical protein
VIYALFGYFVLYLGQFVNFVEQNFEFQIVMAASRAALVALQSFPLLNQSAYDAIMNFQCVVSLLARNRYFGLMFWIRINRMYCV